MEGRDQPLKVEIVVYDLLPPSKLGSFLNLIGSGVYHSSVQLSLPLGPTDLDPTPTEFAFGGHDSPGTTGIFSLPAGAAVRRMPGLRYYTTIGAGEAIGSDWEREFTLHGRARTASPKASVASWLPVRNSSSVSLSTATPSESALVASTSSENGDGGSAVDAAADLKEDGNVDDGGLSDGTQYMSRAERRAHRIIEEMKRDPAWNGTKYRLLERNCNTFTHELVWRLTGRKAPSWLNRAAWVATTVPCIVPPGWIDEADEAAPTAESVDIPDPAHMVTSHDSVSIAPPRANKMSLGGSRT